MKINTNIVEKISIELALKVVLLSVLLIIYIFFPILLFNLSHMIFLLCLSGLAFILMKDLLKNTKLNFKINSLTGRWTIFNNIVFSIIVLSFSFYFISSFWGITSGTSITSKYLSSEEFYKKLFKGYRDIDTIADKRQQIWGDATSFKFNKKVKLTLAGDIYDRTGLLENAFVKYKFDSTFVSRYYDPHPAFKYFIGKYRVPPRNGTGLDNALSNHLLSLESIFDDILHKGDDIHLSVDRELQKVCYDALKLDGLQRKGSVVIMNPHSGDIYALVSSPASLREANPSIFAIPYKSKEKKNRIDSLGNEFYTYRRFNVRRDRYSMGSTIKPFIASLAIENGMRNFRTSYKLASDSIKVPENILDGNISTGDMNRRIRMDEALVKSRNFYFSALSKKISDKISLLTYLTYFDSSFGFNKNILWNTNYPELNTNFPIISSKINNDYILNNNIGVYSLGIGGQEAIEANPIHVAMMLSYIVNEDYLPMPKIEINVDAEAFSEPDFDDESLEIVRELMQKSVYGLGTGRRLRTIRNLKIGSKTGTSTRLLTSSEIELYNLNKRFSGSNLIIRKRGYNSWNITFAAPVAAEDEFKLVMVVVINDAVKAGVRGSRYPRVNETGPAVAVRVSKKIYTYLENSDIFSDD